MSHPLCTRPVGDPFALVFDDPYAGPHYFVCDIDDDDDDALHLAFQHLKTPVKLEMKAEAISPQRSPHSASTLSVTSPVLVPGPRAAADSLALVLPGSASMTLNMPGLAASGSEPSPTSSDGTWGPGQGEDFSEGRNSPEGRARWAAFSRGKSLKQKPLPDTVVQAILGNSEQVPRGELFQIFLDCKGDWGQVGLTSTLVRSRTQRAQAGTAYMTRTCKANTHILFSSRVCMARASVCGSGHSHTHMLALEGNPSQK